MWGWEEGGLIAKKKGKRGEKLQGEEGGGKRGDR